MSFRKYIGFEASKVALVYVVLNNIRCWVLYYETLHRTRSVNMFQNLIETFTVLFIQTPIAFLDH